MVLLKSNCKPNKLWVDQVKEFYNSPMEKWLDDDDILMHLTDNEGKSVLLRGFQELWRLKVIKNNS